MKIRRTTLAPCLCLTIAVLNAADTQTSVKQNGVDMSVPDSPAFTALGLSPQSVTHPASPRGLASTLLNGFDQNGNFQTGIALDTVPYLLLGGNNLDIKDYRRNRWIRFASRLQLSFATTKGTGNADKSSRMAFGVHALPFQARDPRMNVKLTTCLVQAAESTFKQYLPLSPLATPEQRSNFEKGLENASNSNQKGCRDAFANKSWNGSYWAVGFAPTWTSTTGLSKDMQYSGGAFWTSVAYGFEKINWFQDHAQFILHARYRQKDRVPDPAQTGTFYQQDSALFGGQFRAGAATTGVSFEGVYLHTRPVGKPVDNYARLSVGADHRIADNLWLNASIGVDRSRANGGNYVVAQTGLKWAFGSKPVIATQ
jgi:hypothetical protein